MCTNNNLISSCKKITTATIASLSIIAFGFFIQNNGLESVTPPFKTVEATSSNGEAFVISTDGFISSNSSPNYHQPQVSGINDYHHEEEKVVETFTVELTGYSSTEDQTNSQPFVTASGTEVRDGIVAANFLDFGTEIRIPEYFGDKVFVVEDRMNTRYSSPKNNSYNGYVDIWFSSREEAKNFGRVKGEIEILE
ncbi:MAG: 3D domain-containing protein [Patescibacteria group bacterium]